MGEPEFFSHGDYFFEMRALNFLRPLARRRLKTFLPPGVFILFRNPCLRKRRFLWGWKVLFTSKPRCS